MDSVRKGRNFKLHDAHIFLNSLSRMNSMAMKTGHTFPVVTQSEFIPWCLIF